MGVLRYDVSFRNACVFSVRYVLPFYRKGKNNQDQSSVRYPVFVVRTGFSIARAEFDADRAKLPAATVRVNWRTRGLLDQDDHLRMVWAL